VPAVAPSPRLRRECSLREGHEPALGREEAAGQVSGRPVVPDAIFELAPPCAVSESGENGTMTNSESDLTLKDGVLRFKHEATPCLPTTVRGKIIRFNRSHQQKQKEPQALNDWKQKVAGVVEDERGRACWKPAFRYAVTLQFRFCRHENQKLDVDNYVKPVLDGLAKGLGVDDSRFRILLIQRLPDAETTAKEEVRLFVSCAGIPTDTEATDPSGE